MDPYTPRRVVSPRRYLRYLIQKAVIGGVGAFLFVSGILGIVVCVGLIIAALVAIAETFSKDNYASFWVQTIIFCLALLVFVGCVSLFFVRSGIHQMDKAGQLERLAPLTRQTAEQLPAEQSLVRASSEPSEVQQAVLLRAAGADTPTPPEELLRAVACEERL